MASKIECSRLLDGRKWEGYPDGGCYEDNENRSAVR
jgi:hypothetical protein